MSAKVIVDGRSYEMPDEFTFREMKAIKQHTGLRAGEMYEGITTGDADVAIAFAAIAKARAGEGDCWEQLLDLPITKIELDFTVNGDGEGDVGPPVEGTASEDEEEPPDAK